MKAMLTILTIYIMTAKSYQFPSATLPQPNISVVNIRLIKTSIIFSVENNTDGMMLSSLVTGLYTDHSVMISNGNDYSNSISDILSNTDSNIHNIVMLFNELITIDQINSMNFEMMLKNPWSPLHIIITIKNGSLTCDDGKFNKTFLEETEHNMNHIWHKHRTIRVIVSFPYTCPNNYIIYGKKKKSEVGLFDRTIRIIMAQNKKELTAIVTKNKIKELTEGYPLKASIFERFPTSIKQCRNIHFYEKVNFFFTDGFCGLDGLVMHDFVNQYRFNLSIPKGTACDSYGFEDPKTRRISGSLRCILDKKIDISFNSRFMIKYTTKQYSYLHYIAIDSLAAILKRPEEIPLWQYPLNCFSPRTMFILHMLMVILGIVSWTLAWIRREMDGQVPRSLAIYILHAITLTTYGFTLNKIRRFRVLSGTSLICSIILLGIYQGNVNYHFTTKNRYKEIKTLNQLYHSENTLYASPSIQNILINDVSEQDREMKAFITRSRPKNDSFGVDYVLENNHAAITARSKDVVIVIMLNHTDDSDSPLMYVVDEPFHAYYISYICSTDYIFTELTVLFMMRLLEAGLPMKYYVWTRRSLKLGATYPKKGAEPRQTNQIKISDLRVAFILLAVGSLFSSLIFLIEVNKGNSKKIYSVTQPEIRDYRN